MVHTAFFYHGMADLAAAFEETSGRKYENWFLTSFKEWQRGTLSGKDFVAQLRLPCR